MKVLVVDGDADLLDVLTYALRREGFDVAAAADPTRALERWATERPDAAVVDLGLPRGGGFELCRLLRHGSAAPILLLSTSGDEDELVRGLQLGADDFMTKPLSLKLLAARLRALLRRRGDMNPYERVVGEVRAGDLVLNLETHEARNRHGTAALTPLEFKVLYLLAMNEGRVIPYSRLVDYAWGFEGGDANVLKSHVCHIRKKLRLPADGPGSIAALFGVGYSLVRATVADGASIAAPASRHRHTELREVDLAEAAHPSDPMPADRPRIAHRRRDRPAGRHLRLPSRSRSAIDRVAEAPAERERASRRDGLALRVG